MGEVPSGSTLTEKLLFKHPEQKRKRDEKRKEKKTTFFFKITLQSLASWEVVFKLLPKQP